MKLFTLNLEIDLELWFKSLLAITDNKKEMSLVSDTNKLTAGDKIRMI